MAIYACGVLAGLSSASLIFTTTLGARAPLHAVSVRIWGLRAPLGAFISAWGDFLMPLIFISSNELQMLPLGLFRAFLRVQTIDYGFLTALALLYLLPAVIAFGFARRFLIQTFDGGVKG